MILYLSHLFTYLFELQHFESGFPCEQNPDPISADPYLGDRSTKKRPPPKVRNLTFPVQKKRRATTETVTATPQQCEDEVPDEAVEPMNTETGTQTSPKKAPVNQRNRFSKPTSIKCDSCGHYTRPSKSDIKLITKDNFIQTIQKMMLTVSIILEYRRLHCFNRYSFGSSL